MTSSAKHYRTKSANRAEAAMEWLEIHSREAFWVALSAAVIAGGFWFYQKSKAAQVRNAYAALDEAEQALNSGNLPLAQSDLERMVKRYGTTEAGKVGTILLAQVHYQKGEYQAGVDALKAVSTSDDQYFGASALSLAGAGLEQLRKYPEAAESYRLASTKAIYETDKAGYLAASARALGLAGKTAEAKALWTQLAADPTSPFGGEARVRLGEMGAGQ